MTTTYPKNLTTQQAETRLGQVGPNVLPESTSVSALVIFLRQFKSPFIYVLFAAAIFSLILGQSINAFFIFVVLLLNALIGSVQEYSAEKAAAALKKMVPSFAYVIRDNKQTQINTCDLVPGDLVILASGDKVPADVKLHSCHDLRVDESMLTGESIAADKAAIPQSEGAPTEAKEQYCYAGTVVINGRGFGYVIATGAETEIGKIAADVKKEQTKPPLLLRIETFTLRISYSIVILLALIFFITLVRGGDLGTVFLLGVALAVSAIPEGLPAAITVALAIGMRRMARVHVIIRNLVAVEALGSCTYIASDKTGTLTVNEMTIVEILLLDAKRFKVSGEGIDLHGDISPVEGDSDYKPPMDSDADKNSEWLRLLIVAGVLANESYLEKTPEGWYGRGDMVDVAFLILAKKYGVDYLEERNRSREIAQIPYESEQAFCASLNRFDGTLHLFVKGSVERLIAMCSSKRLTPVARQNIEEQVNELAGKGQRTLGLAYKVVDSIPNKLEDALEDLTFLGVVGMIDPLRPDVISAVANCKSAKIQVAMITGDHPETALSLAQQAGIADSSMTAVTGQELTTAYEAGSAEYSRCVHSTKVFARVTPHQKKQIVDQLMHDGEFVAVTGDGVNDAPALSNSHVGIAMGLRGTDVARESADIILTDDHFSSIVHGITQGRVVYNNIRKVIFLLISTGAAEILLVIYSLLFATALPLFPLQLLWLNLVTNGIQDVALAFEPAEGNEIKQPARAPNEAIFNRLMIERVVINAFVMGSLAFSLFYWQINNGVSEFDARNMTLLLMVLFENVHVLNSRSESHSIFKQYFFGNKFLLFGMLAAQGIHILAMYTPGLKDLLQISPVSLDQWLMLFGIATVLIVVDEIHKLIHNSKLGHVN